MTARRGPTPVTAVAAEVAYHVPRHPAPIDLKLDANEGPAPSPGLMTALAELPAAAVQRYPKAAPLEALLAARLGVTAGQVLVTAGGDDGLDRTFRAFLGPKRGLILPEPTFVMLPKYARLVGAPVTSVPWHRGPYPTAAVLAHVGPEVAAIAVVSPNNPTGCVATPGDLRALSAAAPDALIILDAAYAEFAHVALTPIALSLPNVLVFRTLSKAWSLAGARVGYVVGPEALVTPLRAAGNPYAVSGPSLALAHARLASGEADVERYVAAVRSERAALTALLRAQGRHVTDSEGNFVLATCETDDGALWIRDALAACGIAVRAFPGHPDLSRRVRITCPGDATDLARLCAALRAAANPTARRCCENAAQIGAARAEGLIPLGVTAPNASPSVRHALLSAGAARIVHTAEPPSEVPL